jgi:hypothetical protein
MLSPEQRHWCLEQAIEIIKLAPADSLPTHDRLKRVYKRLMSLVEEVNTGNAAASSPAKASKIAKKTL